MVKSSPNCFSTKDAKDAKKKRQFPGPRSDLPELGSDHFLPRKAFLLSKAPKEKVL
jgi:hypothetical protein